jgi:PAS domain S-box-containing protein
VWENDLVGSLSDGGYRRLFESLPDGAAVLEPVFDRAGAAVDYVLLEVNPAFQRLMAVGDDEVSGRRLSDFPLAGTHIVRLASVAASGAPTRYDVYNREIDKHLRVSAFASGEGRLAIILHDATTERVANIERARWLEEGAMVGSLSTWAEKVRETETLFRTTVENIPVNLVVYDHDYRILYINPSLAAMAAAFGLAASEMIGRYGSEVWPPYVWAPFEAHSRRALQTGERQDYELEVPLPDGARVVRQWTVVPIRDDAEIPRLLVLSSDLTAQHRLVDELREADRQKSEFIAVLSHELRNPLAAISSSLYVLERGAPGTEKTVRARESIDRQVHHLARMVDDLLDVTRIARNKITLQRQTVDLREVVQSTIEDNRPYLERGGVRIEKHLWSDPVLVNADPVRIAQVVANLLSNATKFTPASGVATVAVGVDEEGKASLRVTDSGVGIDRDLLPRLFEAFTQADRSLERTGGGLGLGLALVKGLVELHGGEVTARSEGPGKGTEIRVRLPLAADSLSERTPGPPAGLSARRRVLIIEDEAELREGLRVALELDNEHQVEVAATGSEGLEVGRRFHPDVVLCDIGLPGMNGYDVARAFRADPAISSVFLVALSGYAQASDVARAREAGFDQHVAKPASIPKIQGAIAAAFRGSKA